MVLESCSLGHRHGGAIVSSLLAGTWDGAIDVQIFLYEHLICI